MGFTHASGAGSIAGKGSRVIDFFVVSPHGAGLQSFLYYLSALGMPTSDWTQTDVHGDIARALKYIETQKRTHQRVGMTIDKPLPDIRGFLPSLPIQQTPVFWLVRDPLSLLTSCVNQRIGDEIVRTRNPLKAFQYPMAWSALDYAMDNMLLYAPYTYLLYAAQLSSVSASRMVKVIDTTMLTGKEAQGTMKMVAGCFSGPPMGFNNDVFGVAYNSFKNRVQMLFAPRCHIQVRGKELGSVELIPRALFDFRNAGTRPLVIGSIEVDGVEFVCSSRRLASSRVPWAKSVAQSLAAFDFVLPKEEFRQQIRDWNGMIRGLVNTYESKKLTEGHIAEHIRTHKRLLDPFLRQAEDAMTTVDSYAPGLTERWTFTRGFL